MEFFSFLKINNFVILAFELVERGEVLQVPTDHPLTEQQAWGYFRDVILGIEYRKYFSFSFFNFEFRINFIFVMDATRKLLLGKKKTHSVFLS